MNQDDIKFVGLARKGDVSAITTLINRRTQTKAIIAKVSIKGDCIQLLFEAQETPDQKNLTSYARSFLTSLKIPTIHRAKLYGRKRGEDIPAWNTEFEIVEPALKSSQSAAKPEIANSNSSMPPGVKAKAPMTSTKIGTSKIGGSFQLSPSAPLTPEQQKISKSKAYEYGIAGAFFGLIISFPSVWAAFQMLVLPELPCLPLDMDCRHFQEMD